MELPSGQLLRVKNGAEAADFKQAMDQADSQSAAAAVLGVVAAAGGTAKAPRALLAAHAQVSRQLYKDPVCTQHASRCYDHQPSAVLLGCALHSASSVPELLAPSLLLN